MRFLEHWFAAVFGLSTGYFSESAYRMASQGKSDFAFLVENVSGKGDLTCCLLHWIL